jgi:hypothetical protein
MILSIAKHEIGLNFLTKRIWLALAVTALGFSILYEWLLKQYMIMSQAHILEKGYWSVTEEIIHPYFAWMTIFCVFSIPLLSCYSIIKDKKSGAMLLYKIAPIAENKYLFGHVVARLSFSYLTLSFLACIPCIIALDTNVDWLQVGSSYLGVLLLATSIVCISIFAATISGNIVMAMGIAYSILIFLSFLEWFAQFAPNYYLLIRSISFLYPIKNFLSGNLFVIDIMYYIYVSVIALLAAAIVLEWRGGYHVD